MDQPIVAFINGDSGNQQSDELIAAFKELVPKRRQGPLFRVGANDNFLDRLHQAIKYCRDQGAILALCGGDGTVNAALQGALEAGITFTVIPLGTFNYFGRSQGISTNPREALMALADAEVAKLPVAWINDRPFLINASIGLYPKVIAARERHQKLTGRGRFIAVLSGVYTLLREPFAMRVTLVEKGIARPIRTPLILVSVNPTQLDSLNLPEADCVRAGRMALLQMHPTSRWQMFKLMLKGALGQLQSAEHLDSRCVSELEIQLRGHSTRVAIDGELVALRSPLRIRLQPNALTCLVPREREQVA